MNQQSDKVSSHYDKTYFKWHGKLEDRSWANLGHFRNHVTQNDVVLDFGCGAGAILAQLNVRKRLGFEPNEAARERAQENGILTYAEIAEIPDDSLDAIISNSALEHCLTPLDDIKKLRQKLKPGGKAIFVVPCETIRQKWQPNDRNWHLFTWSPVNLGNLFSEAGYEIIESKHLKHRWPPKSDKLVRLLPRPLFQVLCHVFGRLPSKIYQVRLVAIRPE